MRALQMQIIADDFVAVSEGTNRSNFSSTRLNTKREKLLTR